MTPCRRHEWEWRLLVHEHETSQPCDGCPDGQWGYACRRCPRIQDPARSKRGRNNRKRGNSHELAVARKYGGEKVGQLGLPEDIRGAEYRTQVKTHQRLAPTEWRKAFAALESTDNRTPRLILRFLQPGVPADDYIIIRGSAWLDRFGTDEEDDSNAAA